MEKMARRVAATAPDLAVVATPHNVHVTGHMAMLTSSAVAGELEEAATRIAEESVKTSLLLFVPISRFRDAAKAEAVANQGQPRVVACPDSGGRIR
jgi:aromatic ring-opening dioxygenase LigB subunit